MHLCQIAEGFVSCCVLTKQLGNVLGVSTSYYILNQLNFLYIMLVLKRVTMFGLVFTNFLTAFDIVTPLIRPMA